MYIHLWERHFHAGFLEAEEKFAVEDTCSGVDVGIVHFNDEFQNNGRIRQFVYTQVLRLALKHGRILCINTEGQPKLLLSHMV